MANGDVQDRRRTNTSTATSSTMSGTMRRETALTLHVAGPEREPVISRVMLLIWAFLLVVAWILLVVSFTLSDWVEGTEPTDDPQLPYLKREVGLYRQCEQFKTQSQQLGSGFSTERCFDAGFTASNIGAWYASGVLFVVGVLFLSVTIALAVLAAILGRGGLVALAKLCMSFSSIFFLIASVLFPLGFIYLDDNCPVGDEEGHCGLRCTDPSQGMDYFTLCAPYNVGTASFLMFASLVVFFISSFCAACVRTV